MSTVMWMVIFYMTTAAGPVDDGVIGSIWPTQVQCDAEGLVQVGNLTASAGPNSVVTFSYTCNQVIVVQ